MVDESRRNVKRGRGLDGAGPEWLVEGLWRFGVAGSRPGSDVRVVVEDAIIAQFRCIVAEVVESKRGAGDGEAKKGSWRRGGEGRVEGRRFGSGSWACAARLGRGLRVASGRALH